MTNRKRGAKPTPAQSLATNQNFCLRSLAGLQTAFNRAGHYDFEKRVEEVESQFRAKIQGYKE